MASILVVDDSIVMRKNLSTILKGAGHTIVGEASNGRQAITQYNELEPDLVTMDISMPIMSGVEAVQQIIAKHPEAKIIMISAVNQKKMVFNAINSGAKHYIIKPIDAKKVLSVVNEVIETDYDIELEDSMEELSTEQGFEINNTNGKFIVRFNEHLDANDHKLLKMAISGILFIKPLHVIFDFTDLDDVSKEVLRPILLYADDIIDSGGEVSYNTSNTSLAAKLPN